MNEQVICNQMEPGGGVQCPEVEKRDVWPEFCVRQPASDIG